MSQIDTVFISTNFEEVEMEDNPDRLLCRYEFYEILVRIAHDKYIKVYGMKEYAKGSCKDFQR